MFNKQLQEDLLITAIEGGSNYWYYLSDLSMVPDGDEPLSQRIFKAVQSGIEIPVFDLEDEEEELGKLTKTGLNEAGRVMMEKYPRHFKDAMADGWDAETADVYFQLAVMGELTFG